MKQYYYVVEVNQTRGALPFPVDMLRYDGLYPRGETDSGRITDTLQDWRAVPFGGSIELSGWHEGVHWRPTYDRWDSFGWQVVSFKRSS